MYDCSSVFLAGRILTALKFLFRGTCRPACSDQAANIFEVLAWSFTQNRVFDPLCTFDVIRQVPSFGEMLGLSNDF